MSALYLINGKPPQDMGVRVARRELASMNFSRVVLDVVDAELASVSLMTFRDAVTITRDGVGWFQGRVYSTSTSRGANSYGQSIELRDAWWRFNEITYKQSWDGVSSESIQLGAGGNLSASGDDSAAGLFVGAGSQLGYTRKGTDYNDPLAFADEARNILGFAKYTEKLEFTIGRVEGVMPLVPTSYHNRTLHEALADIGMSSPDIVSRFDYSAVTPVLDVIEAKHAGTVSLDIADSRIHKIKITPRDDIRVGAVRINFEQSSGGVPQIAATQIAEGDAIYRPLNITLTLPDGMCWDVSATRKRVNADNGRNNFPVASNLAQLILAKYGRRYYEGDITLKDDDVGGTAWLGESLNIHGGPADWETMAAQIIGVSEDMLSGETTLRIGPAAPSPARALRRISPASNNAGQAGNYSPLETYLTGTTVHVQEGICGRDAAAAEVIPEHTGASYPVAEAGLGATKKVYLGVSFEPHVAAFTCVDADGESFVEYAPIGTGIVHTAKVQMNNTTPPSQGAIVNMQTGVVSQYAVVYFLLALVKWTEGTTPTVQVIRKGNFDLIFIAPNRLYLRAYDSA